MATSIMSHAAGRPTTGNEWLGNALQPKTHSLSVWR